MLAQFFQVILEIAVYLFSMAESFTDLKTLVDPCRALEAELASVIGSENIKII